MAIVMSIEVFQKTFRVRLTPEIRLLIWKQVLKSNVINVRIDHGKIGTVGELVKERFKSQRNSAFEPMLTCVESYQVLKKHLSNGKLRCLLIMPTKNRYDHKDIWFSASDTILVESFNFVVISMWARLNSSGDANVCEGPHPVVLFSGVRSIEFSGPTPYQDVEKLVRVLGVLPELHTVILVAETEHLSGKGWKVMKTGPLKFEHPAENPKSKFAKSSLVPKMRKGTKNT
jgi:hypothetical protein